MAEKKLDAICADAVDVARAAAEAQGSGQVGDHVTVRSEGDRLATHYFSSTHPGYTGWYWAVTVARAARAKVATVDEVVLLPGEEAVRAQDWIPWSDRVRPGDLGPGDLYPTPTDDVRLTAGFTDVAADDDTLTLVSELGLGRERVLTPEGRDDAAHRWWRGDFGPRSEIAEAAAHQCGTCGYYVALTGPLGTLFGACSNQMAPGDGRVVAAGYGCGAHSSVATQAMEQATPDHYFDTLSDEEFDPL